MAILITGGTGFMGLALAEALLARGEQVVLFGAMPPPPIVAQLSQAEIVIGDIRSRAEIDVLLSQYSFDCVIHAAAVTPDLARERRDAAAIVDVNIGGTVNMVERAAAAGIKRLVLVSSVAVYGYSEPAPSGLYSEQDCCLVPAALYGITKLAAEQAGLRLADLHGIDVRIVRLGPVYGPWEYSTHVRDTMSPHKQIIDAGLAGRVAVLPRNMTADWLYSRDAAIGIAGLLRATGLQHQVYNLGGGVLTDLPLWSRHIAGLLPGFSWRLAEKDEHTDIFYGLARDRPAMDVTRIATDTGFKCAYDTARAAADYTAWIGRNTIFQQES